MKVISIPHRISARRSWFRISPAAHIAPGAPAPAPATPAIAPAPAPVAPAPVVTLVPAAPAPAVDGVAAVKARIMDRLKAIAASLPDQSKVGEFITAFGVARFSELPDDRLAQFEQLMNQTFPA